MSLSVSTAEAIKNLVRHDPALCEQLRDATSQQDFTSKLAAAATANGIAVDEDALGQGLELAFKQYREDSELSDEDLQDVTGGVVLTTGGVIALVAVVGIVAGIVGIAGAAGGRFLDKVIT